MNRPGPDDCPSYFFESYASLVPDGDILETLERQMGETADLLASFDEERGNYRYEPGKWSVKELVGHITDTERIFACRALRMARADAQPLPGFEQDDYVAATTFDRLGLAQLARAQENVRRTSLDLFGSLTEEELSRTGTVEGKPFVARSIPWILAGHELHHRGVLVERYLEG